MTESANEQLEPCREAALRLLDRRAYTTAELRRKLQARRYGASVVGTIIDDLVALGILDDLAVAKAHCEFRRAGTRALGRHRILRELERRGLKHTVAKQAIAEVCGPADGEDDFLPALEAGRRQWLAINRRGAPKTAPARLYQFLMRRGFPAEICRRVVDHLRNEPGDTAAPL